MTIKRMGAKEFRELGYLQELNRCFLHPLGLALEVMIDEETGDEVFGKVWDYRDDPEGIVFNDEFTHLNDKRAIAQRIAFERNKKSATRKELLGYTIQPFCK